MYGFRKLIIWSEFQKYLYKHPELKWEEDFPDQDFGRKSVLNQISAGRQKVQHDQDSPERAAVRFSDGDG